MDMPTDHSAVAQMGPTRSCAAAHVGVPPTTFDKMVAAGKMPPPLPTEPPRWTWLSLDRAVKSLRAKDRPIGRRVVRDGRPWSAYDDIRGVYFTGFRDYVKIGHSSSIGARLRELGTHIPEPLILHGFIRGLKVMHERDIHRHFRAHRLNGEWFNFADEIRAYVLSRATI